MGAMWERVGGRKLCRLRKEKSLEGGGKGKEGSTILLFFSEEEGGGEHLLFFLDRTRNFLLATGC
jgi:hypothetical protein